MYKRFQKVLALILAGILCMSNLTPALAAGSESSDESSFGSESSVVQEAESSSGLEEEEGKEEEPQGELEAEPQGEPQGELEEEPQEEPQEELQEEAQEEDPLLSEEDTEPLQESVNEPLLQLPSLLEETVELANLPIFNAAPTPQTPVTADGITIEKITVRWISASTDEEESAVYEDLILRPRNDIAPNQQFQIDFAFSGKGSIGAGDIEVVIPAYIFKDRDGNEPGILTLAIPREGESSGSSDFAWKRVGDSIVMTNVRSVSAGSKYMIQGTFRMTSPDPNATPSNFTTTPAHMMVDVDTLDTEAEYKGVSDKLFATVNVATPNTGEVISMTSNWIQAIFDTYVEAAAASKTAYDKLVKKYNIWFDYQEADIPQELLPDNPDDYFYIKWYVDGRATGNQPFTMTLEEILSTRAQRLDDGREEEFTVSPIVLGATYTPEGTVASADHEHLSVTLFEGFSLYDKSCYIWTAYKKAEFPEEGATYKVFNGQRITVTGADDGVVTTKEAQGELAFRLPIVWKIDKVWEYNEDKYDTPLDVIMSRRPDELKVWLDNKSNGKKEIFVDYLSDDNNWHTEYKDDGSVSNYDAYEHSYDVTSHMHMPDGVSEYPIISGQSDPIYLSDGRYYYYAWSYDHRTSDYDETTHTWTFYNDYHEGLVWGTFGSELELEKKATNHTNNRQKATSDRDLVLLRDGKETTSINYDVVTRAHVLAHTIEPGGMPWETEKLGKQYVTLELHDHGEYFESRELAYDEFRMANFTMYDPQIWVWESDGEPEEGGEETGSYILTDAVPVDMYGLTASDPSDPNSERSWVHYATLQNGTVTAYNGAVADGRYVELPEGVNELRESVRTNAALVEISYNVGIIIFPTEKVQEKVNEIFESTDYGMAHSFNYVDANLYQDTAEGELLGTLTRYDRTYLHGRNYRLAVELDKTTAHTDVDRPNRQVGFTNYIQLTQQSNITVEEEYETALLEGAIPYSQSGVFYDLLPEAMTVDESSISLVGGNIKSIDIIENYRGSSRQLLIVKVDLKRNPSYLRNSTQNPHYGDDTYPIEGYRETANLSYRMWYPFEEAKNRGYVNLRNTAAYMADEDVFGNAPKWIGEEDRPTGDNHKESLTEVREDLRDLMSNLNSERETPSTVYAGATIRLSELDFYSLTALRKYVQVLGAEEWTTGYDHDVNVYEGGKYSYQIILSTGEEATTKDIILLDDLEDYRPIVITNPNGNTYYYEGQIISRREFEFVNSELETAGQPLLEGETAWYWKGSFLSLDVSEIREKGVEPVVYYSFDEVDISVENYNPTHSYTAIEDILQGRVQGKGVWYREDQVPQDKNLADITAIAIDCRKTPEGEDFELTDGAALVAYVHMQAPTHDTWPDAFAEEDYWNHYNNAHAFNNIFMDVTQVDEMGVETHSYDHYDYTMVGIMTYNLEVEKTWEDENNNDGKRPDSVWVELYRDGVSTGKRLELKEEENWYGVFEYIPMFTPEGIHYTYTLVEDPVEGYTSSVYLEDNRLHLVNTHSLETVDIPFQKIWTSNEAPGWEINIPERIIVRLYADGVYTGSSMIVRPDASGNWHGVFEGLPKYYMGELIEYSVDEAAVPDGFYKVLDNTGETKVITNIYYPYGDLRVFKQISSDTITPLSSDKKFPFTLSLQDAEGNAVIGKYEYVITNVENSQVVDTGRMGNGDTVLLGHLQQLLISDIPQGAHYEVSEGIVPGFSLTFTSAITGVISASESKSATFVNTYAARGQAAFKGKKLLEGREITRSQFRFIVEDEAGNVLQSVANDAEGNILFADLVFTQADDGQTFTYYVSELDRGKLGYAYDPIRYKVVVKPRDLGNGQMECPLELSNADTGEPLTEVLFRNTYQAYGEVLLRAWKDQPGKKLEGGEYEFELLDADGERLVSTSESGTFTQLVENDEYGQIEFYPIGYSQEDIGKSFYYVVREVPGDDPAVVYDPSIFGYQVEVLDNGDGTLFCQYRFVTVTEESGAFVFGEETEDLPVFVNHLAPGNLSVTKNVHNPEEADPNQEFRFRIKLIGPNIESADITFEKTGVADTVVIFHGMGGSFAGVPGDNEVMYRSIGGGVKFPLKGEYLEPEAQGHTFLGWYEDPEYTTPYEGSLTFEDIETDLDLYAKWEVRVLDVIFHSVEGTLVDPQYVTYGELAQEPADPTRPHARFEGWYTDAAYTNRFEFTTPVTDDLELYAKWSQAYAMYDSSTRTLTFFRDEPDKHFDSVSGREYYSQYFYGYGYLEDELSPSAVHSSNLFPWYNRKDSITTVVVQDPIYPKTMSYWFSCKNLTTFVNPEKIITSDVTSFFATFDGAQSLEDEQFHKIVRSWDLSSGKDFYWMFSDCDSLEYVDLTGLRMDSAEDIKSIFSSCNSLKELVFDNVTLGPITSLEFFAYNCPELTYVSMKGCETPSLISMNYAFMWDRKLETVELDITMSNVTSLYSCFYECESLRRVSFGSSIASSLETLGSLFYKCFSLEEVDLSTFNTSNVTSIDRTFYNNSSLRHIYVSDLWNLDNVTDSSYMFSGAQNLPNFSPSYTDKTRAYYGGDGKGYLEYKSAPASLGNATTSGQMSASSASSAYRPVALEMDPVDVILEEGRLFGDIPLSPMRSGEESLTDLGNGEYELILRDGEAFTFSGIPAGTAYQVYEETPSGWQLIEQVGVSGKIEANETCVAYFINEYKPGSTSVQFSGTKTLDGQAAEAGAFSFVLSREGVDLQIVETMEGGFFQFAPIVYTEEGQYVYTIRELAPSGRRNIRYDEHEETVIVDVSRDTAGNLQARVTYDDDRITFRNLSQPAELIIEKIGEGVTEANQETEFTFKVTFENDNGIPFSSSEDVYWYLTDRDGNLVRRESAYQNAFVPHAEVIDESEEQAAGAVEAANAAAAASGSLLMAASSPAALGGVRSGFRDASSAPNPLDNYPASDATIIESGNYTYDSSSTRWELYSDGTMVLKPMEGEEGVFARYSFRWYWQPWYSVAASVKYVKVEGILHARGSALFQYLFDQCKNLEYVDLSGFEMSGVTRIYYPFHGAAIPKYLNVSGWDTSNITEFIGALDTYADYIDVSSFDTSRATSLNGMFSSCSNLKELDLSHFDTSHVQSAFHLFSNCTSLERLNLDGWDTSQIHIGESETYGPWFIMAENLKEVVLGPNFVFDSSNMILPTPPEGSTTGKWVYTEDESLAFTPVELYRQYDGRTMAGTWVWQMKDTHGAVSFNANGGFSRASNVIADSAETPVVMPGEDLVSRPHYTLAGWNTKADGTGESYQTGESYTDLIELGKTLTLYAIWEESDFNRSIRVEHHYENPYYGEEIRTEFIAVDRREGSFTPEIQPKEYFLAPDPVTVQIPDHDHLVVRYYYARERYTIQFDGNGADYGEMYDQMMYGDIEDWLYSISFHKEHSLFESWNTEPDGSGISYTNRQAVKNLGRDGETIVLYAQWLANDNILNPTKGEVIVKARAGEQIHFPDLPAGTRYRVEEIKVPDGWSLTEHWGDTGTLRPGRRYWASFYNNYQADTAVQIVAHKKLLGATLRENQFSFVLNGELNGMFFFSQATNGSLDTEKYLLNEEGQQVENPFYGTAPVIFDPILLTQPGEYEFTIWEDLHYADPSIYNFDSRGAVRVHIVATDNGDGTLSTEITYRHYEESKEEPIFVNSLKPGNLKLTKSVNHATAAAAKAQFPVSVSLKDSSGNDLEGSYEYKVFASEEAPVTVKHILSTSEEVFYSHTPNIDDEGNAEGTYPSNHHQKEVFQVPGAEFLEIEVTYSIETGYDGLLFFPYAYEGEFEPSDLQFLDPSVIYRPDRMSTMDLSAPPITETITIPGDTVTLYFYSDSSVQGYGYHAIVRGTGYEYDEVETGEMEMVMKEQSSGTVSHGDVVMLPAGGEIMIYGLPNGTRYELTEEETPGWLLVDASGNTGYIYAGETSSARFENTYSSVGSLELEALKRFVGGELEEGMFRFELFGQDNNLLQTKSTDAEGKVSFDPIIFNQSDDGRQFIYYIQEVAGTDPQIVYDDHVAEIVVNVKDNGYGELTAEITLDEENALTFTNVKHQEIEVAKEVSGSLGDKTEAFNFILTLEKEKADYHKITFEKTSDEDPQFLEEGEVTLSEEGTFEFTLRHGERIRFSGVVDGIAYSVREVEANQKGYMTTMTSEKALSDGSMQELSSTREGTLAGTLSGSKEVVSVVNHREPVVEVGIWEKTPVQWGVYLLVLLAGIGAFFLARGRKARREKEN